jgi:hypothetical protein
LAAKGFAGKEEQETVEEAETERGEPQQIGLTIKLPKETFHT